MWTHQQSNSELKPAEASFAITNPNLPTSYKLKQATKHHKGKKKITSKGRGTEFDLSWLNNPLPDFTYVQAEYRLFQSLFLLGGY